MRTFIRKSGDTIGWLEAMGITFFEIAEYFPTQGPRIMHLPEGMGAGLTKILLATSRILGVNLLRDTAARKIIIGQVMERVMALLPASKEKEVTIASQCVIIAAGGYAGNRDLLKKYYPNYTDDLHLVGLPHQGDGLQMAIDAGAATEGLGTLLLRGPYFQGIKPGAHRGHGT